MSSRHFFTMHGHASPPPCMRLGHACPAAQDTPSVAGCGPEGSGDTERRGWSSALACALRTSLIFHGLETQQALGPRK